MIMKAGHSHKKMGGHVEKGDGEKNRSQGQKEGRGIEWAFSE